MKQKGAKTVLESNKDGKCWIRKETEKKSEEPSLVLETESPLLIQDSAPGEKQDQFFIIEEVEEDIELINAAES